MCGIAGGIAASDSGFAADVERMSAAIAHRGPDDHGIWADPSSGVVMAHRRLSIIDLSPAGHQPMMSAAERWVLVLNGEIYDHATHRASLESTGRMLRGHSDTEVLLELIARDGVVSACHAVTGMFAFAAWDREERVLYLGRDRMGEKPLFYGGVGTRFVFSSELTPLRRLPGGTNSPDREAVAAFLRLGFVPAPLSIMEGIRKVLPGTIVRVSLEGEASAPECYWSIEDVANAGVMGPAIGSEEDWIAEGERLLLSSVQRQLVADVPVGAFLSGGLDSSTIVALAQQTSSRPVRSFTVAVGGADDESDAAAAVARHLGTDHTTLPLPEIDALDLAQSVTSIYDEPFADPSAIPTTLLCRAAREHVTVCLSGDGADELLGGYNRYMVTHGTVGRLMRLPSPLRRALGVVLTAGSPAQWDSAAGLLPGRAPGLGTKAHKLARVLRQDSIEGAYSTLANQWDPAHVLIDSTDPRGPQLNSSRGLTDLQSMLLADQQRTLPDDMLVKVDRASMAVALEVRVPFLDHRFVEFSWRLPDHAKIRGGQGKWLLRQILTKRVPNALWERPKLGFDPPLAEWLRGPLREWAHDLLSPERLKRQGLLRPEPVARALAAHDAGRVNHDYQLWTLLMLESWLDAEGGRRCTH